MIIQNEHVLIEAEVRGAQLMRIYSVEHDHEYLWINDPNVWGWRSPLLFPVIGELKEGKYQYAGKTYLMERHGFLRDATFETRTEGPEMVFSRSFDECSLVKYPFKFNLEVRYLLEGKSVKVKYLVQNMGDTDMPFSIGGHPAFSTNPVDKHFLVFEEQETVFSDSLDRNGLRTGVQRTGIINGRIDLTNESFNDDALVFSDLRSEYCELHSTGSSRGIRFWFGDFPYLGVWSKPGAPFVCIEPWQGVCDSSSASGNILEKEGIVLLSPGAVFNAGYKIEVF